MYHDPHRSWITDPNSDHPKERTLKREAGVFKFLRVEEHFRKRLRLRDGLVWTVGPAVEKKLRFKISLA